MRGRARRDKGALTPAWGKASGRKSNLEKDVCARPDGCRHLICMGPDHYTAPQVDFSLGANSKGRMRVRALVVNRGIRVLRCIGAAAAWVLGLLAAAAALTPPGLFLRRRLRRRPCPRSRRRRPQAILLIVAILAQLVKDMLRLLSQQRHGRLLRRILGQK